jgi:hypothetical protein
MNMVDKTSQYIPHNSSPCGIADKYWNIVIRNVVRKKHLFVVDLHEIGNL